ncbi:ABC transporter ATP-binding protein [Sandaracinobacteroides saxicola]|uniref:ABC transporter ATP-binding protein n=1 Tax=Sandaracinobacteroides saxicola TaxID=2759707 RepID=A0A7G5IKN6_9SPHN|nr:ABC transporter ATP-binding protein [Sandaracinobacteroides saxicola]QMW23928.1 ABC transporter ATP-binding protein [Sandaracinobacteroides saxicola]
MLTAHKLHLNLGGTPVLHGLTAAFTPGRITVILGPNGAGKSSLLACLAGLTPPTSGRLTLDDQPISSLGPRDRARRIGLLPQVAELHWNISVAALVALGRLPHAGRFGLTAADHAAIAAALAATDTAHLAARPALNLSGGERARVLLARVLAGQPRWLLADEPLASLDPAHALDILGHLRASADAGTGVVLVLHDLAQAARIADDVLLMRAGRIAAHGPATAVLTPEALGPAYGVTLSDNLTPLARLR